MPKVWLDAGHGGSDSGAISGNNIESKMNMSVALSAKNELERHGIIVGLSRSSDIYIELEDRCKLANAFNANIFCSIHFNNAGIRTNINDIIFHDSNQESTKKIENRLYKELGHKSKSTPIYSTMYSRGTDYYDIIKNNNMPTYIIEEQFIDGLYAEYDYKTIGIAIAHGILDILNIFVISSINIPDPTIEIPLLESIIDGDINTAVIELQNKLFKVGYNIDVDGEFDTLTSVAIKDFQYKHKLTSDGNVTSTALDMLITGSVSAVIASKITSYQLLVNSLGIDNVTVDGNINLSTRTSYSKMPLLTVGSTGVIVEWIQNIVGVKVDGIFGKDTCEAIKDYQNYHGISDDGIIGISTYMMLVED